MIELAKYTPVVDVPDDDYDIRFQSFGYDPILDDGAIDEYARTAENLGSREMNDIIDGTDTEEKNKGFVFTDEMRRQLRINLGPERKGQVTGRGLPERPAQKRHRVPYKGKSEWSNNMAEAYRRAGISNENAIRMLVAQDGLESGWGRSAQGRFNYGNITTGASWKGNYVNGRDKNAKGEPIRQKFRSYDSLEEYAIDKVNFLKRLYDFDENDDIVTFAKKLKGGNKGKRNYADDPEYKDKIVSAYNSIS